jgi:hypothetical protein
MSIVNKSEEITTIIYEDGSGEVYRRNDFNSPYVYRGTTITRWMEWLDVLQKAENHPEFEKLLDEVETLYRIIK